MGSLLLRAFAFVAVYGVLLFGAAGRWDLPFFWALLGLLWFFISGLLLTIDPELRRERLRPAAGGWDRWLRAALAVCALGQVVVAGLDVGRFGWSGELPAAVQLAGLAVFAAGLGVAWWAMRVNRFFTPAIRIQEERGHHVVQGGPYRFVRHPGYLATSLGALAGSLALGSWWSLLPAAGYVAFVVRRTALEDRFLRQALTGYADYAGRVRYRLLPGLW